MRALLQCSALVLMVAVSAGCGGTATQLGYTPKSKDRMDEVSAMFKSYIAANKGNLPKKLSDLDPFEPANQYGFAAIRDGEVVMFWGGAKSTESASIVQAHDKSVASTGGFVLMQDGTVKEMSAAEFGSAKKAK